IDPSYFSFDHNSRPTSVDGKRFGARDIHYQIPEGREYYLLATLDVGQSSMGVTSRNGIWLEAVAEVEVTPSESSITDGRGYQCWGFGGRYDAGTNFIWRNQGVIETHHPAVTVDLPITGYPVQGPEPILGTMDVPGHRWVRFGFSMMFTVIGWNDGVGGEAPVNFFDTPEVRMRLWGFPVVA